MTHDERAVAAHAKRLALWRAYSANPTNANWLAYLGFQDEWRKSKRQEARDP